MNPHRQQQKKDDQNHLSPNCPSFNTYTADTQIAEIASRVVNLDINNTNNKIFDNDSDDDDDDFQFGLAYTTTPESIQVYPVFNQDLLRDLGSQETSAANIQLRSLFFEEDNERERLSASSSVLDEVASETYCLWTPKSPEMQSPSRCMKSSSTGSRPAPPVAKTWRLRNLLRRCKSDGREGLMLMTTSKKGKAKSDTGLSRPSSSSPSPSPPWRGSNKEVDGKRRKSYLPYKQELLGFFGSPQTLRKINIPPF